MLKSVLPFAHKSMGLALALALFSGAANSADWPTYRCDMTRGGYTSEHLPEDLSLHWRHAPRHAPQPGWPLPAKERARVRFDEAFHVAVADGMVYFGSSVDNQVYALDAATGEVAWSAYTGGPVRLAPTVWKDRVYAGSDDGFAYCFNAKDGNLLWKVRGGLSERQVLGNGKMISLWPVRTGVLVDKGVAYFGAGVFPHESVFINAVDARTGELLWRNDSVGETATTANFGGLSPQGYLLATRNTLLTPSARALPAAFDRETGELLYFCKVEGKIGGTWAMIAGDELVTGTGTQLTHALDDGELSYDMPYAWFPALSMVVRKNGVYLLTFDGLSVLTEDAYKKAMKEREPAQLAWEKKNQELQAFALSIPPWNSLTDEQIEEVYAKYFKFVGEMNELEAERKAIEQKAETWKLQARGNHELIMAGDTLYVGGSGRVFAVKPGAPEVQWEAPVQGDAVGLAASDGRLFVSTDTGDIYCFGEEDPGPAKTVTFENNAVSWPGASKEVVPKYEAALATIKSMGVDRGYCLVYGADTGALVWALAQQPGLYVIGAEPDGDKVARAREALNEAGLWGARAIIVETPLDELPFSDYFADLVVTDWFNREKLPEASMSEMLRLLKPCGGIALMAPPFTPDPPPAWVTIEQVQTWTGPTADVQAIGSWIKITRGPLEGAGEWTHLYADAANTACSQDEIVKGALGVLWFGEPGPEQMVDRHARVSAPVAKGGRFFVQGEDVILAHDAYNGIKLWEKTVPGSTRVRVDSDMNNIVLGEDGSVYVAAHDECLRLDPATGKTLRTFRVPKRDDKMSRRWGYVATVGDVLVGSSAEPFKRDYGASWEELVTEDGKAWRDPDILPDSVKHFKEPDIRAYWAFQQTGMMWHSMTQWPDWGSVPSPEEALTDNMKFSDAVFAMNVDTGEQLWEYRGEVIAHPAIAMSGDTIFFADACATDQQKRAAIEEKKRLIAQGVWEKGADNEFELDVADVRRLVAADINTGEVKWERMLDLTGCGGDRLGLAYRDGLVLAFGCFSNHDKELFQQGKLQWRRITAVNVADGSDAWSRPLNYLRRPVIIDDEILVEPRACDLYTGEIKSRKHPLTSAGEEWEFVRPGHSCSVTSASTNMFFLRGFHMWYYDLEKDRGMLAFGGIRTGCWISVIPANGLVMFPEASSGCTCSYPIRSTVVMAPREEERTWGIFIQHGEMTPVRHLAVNFGAPGDWRDDDGKLWFGYPHPPGNEFLTYGVDFDFREEFAEGGRFLERNFQGLTLNNAGNSWLYASSALGMKRFSVPLLGEGDAPAAYDVKLYFAETAGAEPGQRVFDVKIQGRTVLEDLDIAGVTHGNNAALVRSFKNIAVNDALEIELVPADGSPDELSMPVISALEVTRADAA